MPETRETSHIPGLSLSPYCFIKFLDNKYAGKKISFFNFGKTRLTMLASIETIHQAGRLEKKGKLDRQAFNADYIHILGKGAFTAPQSEWENHKRRMMRHLTPTRGNDTVWENVATNTVRRTINQWINKPSFQGQRYARSLVQSMNLEVFFGSPDSINTFKLGIVNTVLMLSLEAVGFTRLWLGGYPGWLMKLFQSVGHAAGNSLAKLVDNAVIKPGSPASDPEFHRELHTLLFAGQDTITSALVSCMWIIANDEPLQNRLRNEVLDTGKNHLLKQTILETLRLMPPLHTPPIRLCSENVKIDGTSIPAGAHVLYGIWHAHRRCLASEQFKPERFNDVKSTKLIIPFGTGPKRCVGEHIALVYLSSVLAELLATVSITTLDKTMILNPRTIVFPNKPIRFSFQPLIS